MEREALYVQLGNLIAEMPKFDWPLSADAHRWLGRAYALIEESNSTIDAAAFRVATMNMQPSMTRSTSQITQELSIILYRVLAIVELETPQSVRGAFINAGSAFDALTAISKVLAEPKRDILIIDPYMDEKVLTDFALQIPMGVAIRLLADSKNVKSTLRTAAARWIEQYRDKRPLSVKLAPERSLHDRLIACDNSSVWVLTQSFNSFASRSPASIVRVDSETAALKLAAYDTTWREGKDLIL